MEDNYVYDICINFLTIDLSNYVCVYYIKNVKVICINNGNKVSSNTYKDERMRAEWCKTD